MDFVGRWCNEEGNILVIRRLFKARYLIRYIRKDGKLLLQNRIYLTISMFPFGCFGKIEGEDLVMSICGIWGPWIHFHPSVSEVDDTETLLPDIEPSINDGYEDIMGIGWLQPLSPFRRIS